MSISVCYQQRSALSKSSKTLLSLSSYGGCGLTHDWSTETFAQPAQADTQDKQVNICYLYVDDNAGLFPIYQLPVAQLALTTCSCSDACKNSFAGALEDMCMLPIN